MKSLLAAIDVGTNTLRMMAAHRDGRSLRPVARMRRITGMGRTLRATGAVGEPEFGRSIAALREFRREMDRLGVVQYRACGTAALREASNRDRFLSAAEAQGVRIEVIPPEEEARMTWAGATRAAPADGAVLMDIGGGSTEFVVGPGAGESVSLPLGVVDLLETFRLSDPPRDSEVGNLVLFLDDRIGRGTDRWRRRTFRRLVGTAGTFTTLAALDLGMRSYRPERIDGHRMTARRLLGWARRLTRLSAAQRLALPGMERGRERFIVPGAWMAVAATTRFGVRELRVSDSGILEGILLAIPPGKG